MSKHTTSFDEFEDMDDPFASLGKSRFVKKNYLRDNKIQFGILGVTGPSEGKFGLEVTIDIQYVDYETGELTDGILQFPYKNQKGAISKRAEAILKVQTGLGMGKTYDGYYLIGSGSGYLLTKVPPKQA